jgi:hypothetical protein
MQPYGCSLFTSAQPNTIFTLLTTATRKQAGNDGKGFLMLKLLAQPIEQMHPS